MNRRSAKKENWKEIKLPVKGSATRYAISDQGNICSFREFIGDGRRLKGALVNGYPALKLKIKGKDFQHYVHKLVALHFVKKQGRGREYVIHLDFNKLNNSANNLRWATRSEMMAHQQDSPLVRSYREKTKKIGSKLTAGQVSIIKRKIFSLHRRQRLKDIAAQFGISEMQLYRIKSGENWGHVG